MNVLILHGIMGKAGENWGQWLHDELSKKGYTVQMPTLPQANHPDRREWLRTITNLMATFSGDTIIVAHSLGVTSALDYLEATTHPLKGLISISGFADDYGLELNSYFLAKKPIDFAKVHKNLEQAFVFFGDNDPYVPQASLQALANELSVTPVIIPNGGHLNAAAGFTRFPQVLDVILSV